MKTSLSRIDKLLLSMGRRGTETYWRGNRCTVIFRELTINKNVKRDAEVVINSITCVLETTKANIEFISSIGIQTSASREDVAVTFEVKE
jgi:hypothetical protein